MTTLLASRFGLHEYTPSSLSRSNSLHHTQTLLEPPMHGPSLAECTRDARMCSSRKACTWPSLVILRANS